MVYPALHDLQWLHDYGKRLSMTSALSRQIPQNTDHGQINIKNDALRPV